MFFGSRVRRAAAGMTGFLSLFLTLCIFATASLAAGPSVERVRIGTFEDYTRVVIRTNAPVSPRLFTLGDPERLIVDLPEIDWEIPRPSGPVDSRLISEYRFGLFEPGVSRLVFALTGPAKVQSVDSRPTADGESFELDVQLSEFAEAPSPVLAGLARFDRAHRDPAPRSEALPTAPLVDRTTRQQFRSLRFDPDEAQFDALGEVLAALGGGEAAAASQPAPEKRAQRDKPQVAPSPKLALLAPQALGGSADPPAKPRRTDPAPEEAAPPVRRPVAAKPLRIVIDPGHGGRDPGTANPEVGVHEKTVVLAFANELLALLREDPAYDVSATRETDRFVPLPDRVKFAREKDADLMISIHADWFHDSTVKGATAYTLSEEASMRSAENIASGHSRHASVAGIAIGDEREDVVRVLLDLTRRETQTHSQRFAELVIDEFDTVTPVVRGVRHDDLHVLRTPDLPAVLLELGFMSNEEDRARMQSQEWRTETARSVKRALDRWRNERGVREFARR